VQLTDATTGKQRDLDRPNQLVPAKVRPRRIDCLAPPPQLGEWQWIQKMLELLAPRLVHVGRCKKRIEECADVEAGAANHQRHSRFPTDTSKRFDCHACPPRCGEPLIGLRDIDADVLD
jgi:hypothetical protein